MTLIYYALQWMVVRKKSFGLSNGNLHTLFFARYDYSVFKHASKNPAPGKVLPL